MAKITVKPIPTTFNSSNFEKLRIFSAFMKERRCDGNEALTREQLIRPFFKYLGYYVDNNVVNGKPTLDLWPEDTGKIDSGNRCDFVMRLNDTDSVHIVIEAKPVNRDLDKAVKGQGESGTPTEQLARYFNSGDWRQTRILGVLTNGFEYRFFKETRDKQVPEMDMSPFFVTDLQSLAENKDNSLQKLWNYASRSVIEQCSKIKWSQEEGATDSPTLTYQSHFEACSQIEKVREIVNQNLQNGLSPQYFRNLIKEDKRNILNTILWSEAGIELLINNLYQNSSQKRKDKAESEYRSWLDILTSILDACERNKVDSKDVIDEEIKTTVIQVANGNNTMDSINPTDISKYITTEREIAIANKISNICNAGDIRFVDDKQFITFIISDESQNKIRQGIIPKNKGNTAWFLRFGNIEPKDNTNSEHAQNGDPHKDYINACLGFNLDSAKLEELLPGFTIIRKGDTATRLPSIQLTSLEDM